MNSFIEILKHPDLTTIIITIISLLGAGFIFKISSKKNSQKQKSGNNSTNYQAGNDINL